ncbi:LysM peptidoglycan-binding domain-containing protein [Peribacillus loiseleuriae]|uniref:LysM peptidoglycan-binding domain-containing protein n=1 Tax=Peribacillus loiseleuriae TaxID=1679170 RepID=UPI0006718109|nr:LysM peptidoglycan-binding domain-containing protein [Peribacillus loiseleuriae]
MNPENITKEYQKNNVGMNSKPLPSRSELRAKKKKKRKNKFPLIKILAAFFIAMPVAIYFLLPYLEKQEPISLTPQKKISGFETVEVTKRINSVESNETVGPEQGKTTDMKAVPAVSKLPKGIEEPEGKSSASVSEMKEKKDKKQDSKDGYQIVYHTVSPNESLFIIAMNYYKSAAGIERIKEWNHIKGDEIQVGQVLKIPVKENE